MLKASNAKPEAWVSWQIETEHRRCGTAEVSMPCRLPHPSPGGAGIMPAISLLKKLGFSPDGKNLRLTK
jgi:hypothetical protein